jgi:hypothetical protein
LLSAHSVPRYEGIRREHLKVRSDVKKLWSNATRSLCGSAFEEIDEALHKAIVERFLPMQTRFYYKNAFREMTFTLADRAPLIGDPYSRYETRDRAAVPAETTMRSSRVAQTEEVKVELHTTLDGRHDYNDPQPNVQFYPVGGAEFYDTGSSDGRIRKCSQDLMFRGTGYMVTVQVRKEMIS